MKNRYFSNAPRNHKLQGVKIKLRDDSSIHVTFKKVIWKWVGVANFWEGQVEHRAKCGRMVIFSGLNQGIFQIVPDT